MAGVSSNIVTNHLTNLVALRFLVNASFLTVGAKANFKDQLVGKNNGQEYDFVIRDSAIVEGGEDIAGQGAGTDPNGGTNYVNGLTHSAAQEIKETSVKMKLIPWHIMVNTNAVETVTDERWEDEVAKPNGAKLAQKVTRDVLTANIPIAATASIGTGFQPLAEAGAFLESISSEKVYGFIDPKFQAILTSNGQAFSPVGSPDDMYKSGLLGTFHSVEYRAQRFFPVLKVSKAQADTLAGATIASAATSGSTLTVGLSFSAASDDFVIKAGTPFKFSNVFACDLLGDLTAENYAFILNKDVPVAKNAQSASLTFTCKFANFALATNAHTDRLRGTDVFGIEYQGAGYKAVEADFTGSTMETLTEGTWYMGQLRLDGAFEFETLDKLDASNAETKVGSVPTDSVSITVHQNRVVNLDNMTSKTRWDIVAMAGNTDPRAVTNVYTKVG